MTKPDHDHIYQMVESQGGYFTTRQAHQAGLSRERLSYYARPALSSRNMQGIYTRLPALPFDDLIVVWHTLPDFRPGQESRSCLAVPEIQHALDTRNELVDKSRDIRLGYLMGATE